MGDMNVKPSDRATLLARIVPGAKTAATYVTGWVDMGLVHNLLALISVGALGTLATIDAKLQQATDGSGTAAKDIVGKLITQLTEADSPNDSLVEAVINLSAEQLDVDGNFTHAQLSITVAVATSDAAGYLFGLDNRYQARVAVASLVETVG